MTRPMDGCGRAAPGAERRKIQSLGSVPGLWVERTAVTETTPRSQPPAGRSPTAPFSIIAKAHSLMRDSGDRLA